MGIVENAAAWIARTLEPLAFACGSEDDELIAFVAKLGWDLPTVPPALRASHANLAQVHDRLVELQDARWRVATKDAPPEAMDPILSAMAVEVLAVADDLHALGGRLRAELPVAYVAATRIDDEFEQRVLDWLVVDDIANRSALVSQLLRLLGVIEETDEPEDPTRHQPAYTSRRVRWERLTALLSDPGSVARDVYGWGTHRINAERLFGSLVPLSFTLAAPGEIHYPEPGFVQAIAPGAVEAPGGPDPQLWVPVFNTDDVSLFLAVFVVPTTNPTQAQAIAITLVPTGGLDTEVPLGAQLTLQLQATAQIGSGAALVMQPGDDPVVVLDVHKMPTAFAAGRFVAEVRSHPIATDGAIEQGTAGALRLGAEVRPGGGAEVFAELHIEQARLAVDAPAGDGLLTRLMPSGGVTVPVTATVRWSHGGLSFAGAAGLEATVPLDVVAGPLRLRDLHLRIAVADDGVTASAGVTAGLTLGPVALALADLGVRIDGQAVPGNLGPFDLAVGATPPTGAGIAVDAGILAGGGYLRRDPASGRYAGVLDLRARQVDITALGLLDTRLPAGHGGYALLLALRATFPAVQIGLGFALTGVGGLLALNRRVDVDALRGRLAAGTAGRILAPADPVRNAPSLLADLDTVFPVAPGVTVVGPTAQLLWAGLVHLDVGVFIELPGPARVVLLGSAHAEIERGSRAYLSIRVDIVGVVDLRAETAAFDAVLINSHLMGTLDLTGGAAFRLSWGAQPYAVLSLGGFNPAYHPEPLSFPATLTPIAMVHGRPGDELYLRFEGYFAITSNTLQFGASVEVRIHSDPFTVHGSLGFDALIQFEPFHFEIDIRASVSLAYNSHTLAGLTLTGSLTGPGPVVLHAKVCIELLFFDICFSGTFTLGPSSLPPVPGVADLLDLLLAEVTDPARLRAAGAPDRYVRLRPPDPSLTTPVVSPTGTLVWEQQRAPLGLLLTRVGGTPLPVPVQVSASAAHATPESDWFAPGQFTDLTDDQALTRPAYERLTAGLRLGGTGTADGPGKQVPVTTRQIRLPAKAITPDTPVTTFPAWIVTSAARPAIPAVTVGTEKWIVTSPTGERSDLTGAQARQLATLTSSARAIPATDRLAALVF